MEKLKFEETELCYVVKEEGIDTNKVHFETIGLIPKDKENLCFKIDDNFSGILELNTIKEILNFMEKLKRVCERCGERFEPTSKYHFICYDCWKRSMDNRFDWKTKRARELQGLK